MKKIMVCQPYMGGEDHQARDNRQEFLVKSARWCDANGFEMVTANMGRYVIHTVREDMCEAALKTGCEFVLFVDDDMILPLDTLSRLMESMKDLDIVSPLTFQRVPPFFPVMYRLKVKKIAEGQYIPEEFDKITEWNGHSPKTDIDAMGFGCVLMKTEILKKIHRPWFASWTTIGEDIWFSWRAKEAGFKIGIDTSFWIGHLADRPMIGLPQFEEFQKDGRVTCWKYNEELLDAVQGQ